MEYSEQIGGVFLKIRVVHGWKKNAGTWKDGSHVPLRKFACFKPIAMFSGMKFLQTFVPISRSNGLARRFEHEKYICIASTDYLGPIKYNILICDFYISSIPHINTCNFEEGWAWSDELVFIKHVVFRRLLAALNACAASTDLYDS